jgi:hypothetical protein
VDFALGVNNTVTAANIAAAINASVIAPNYVSAVSTSFTVTITTNSSGSPGVGILFSTVSGGRLVLSGATFTGAATDPENGDWYLETPFGDTRSSGSTVTITSTPADEALGTSYGYGYTDPFLNGRRVSAFDAKVAVSRDTAGVGGATLSLRDTHKEARLASICWVDKGPLGKFIFRSDTITLVGSTPYWHQGWNGLAGDLAYANGPEVILTGDRSPWTLNRTLSPYFSTGAGRFMEFRLSIEKYTLSPSTRASLSFACEVSSGPTRAVYLDFRTGNRVALCAVPNGAALALVAVPWSDGNARTYLLTHNVGAGTVTLHVDGVLSATVALVAFAASGLSGSAQVETDGTATFTAWLHSLCYGVTEEGVAGLGRTFGLYKGGDMSLLDSWAIPRSDALPVPNSDPTSIPVPMDWTSECWVRVFIDPTYGASFIRPDLAPPPGYTGDFATQSMDPSAGWVTVEYSALPRITPPDRFGVVSFGALNPSGSVVSSWDEVRYRVFTNTSVDYRAPQGMTLNRWNVITSNDFARDVTPEEVVVASTTAFRVSLRPCHIFADRVFAVRIDGATIPQNLWTFNKDSQELTLTAGVPSSGYPVNVIFAPGRPITSTYLASQMMAESQTLLNEGTPPLQASQAGMATYTTISASTVSGSGGKAPKFPPVATTAPDYFLRDQYLVREFSDTDELYERMEFIQLDDGGMTGRLTPYCEGGPGAGGTWSTTEFSFAGGTALTDDYSGTRYGSNRGPGTYRYSLMASGAGFDGGELGTDSFRDPVTAVVAPFSGTPPAATGMEPPMLYATAPSSTSMVIRGEDDGAVIRETLFVLRVGAPPGTVTIWTGGSQAQTWG